MAASSGPQFTVPVALSRYVMKSTPPRSCASNVRGPSAVAGRKMTGGAGCARITHSMTSTSTRYMKHRARQVGTLNLVTAIAELLMADVFVVGC